MLFDTILRCLHIHPRVRAGSAARVDDAGVGNMPGHGDLIQHLRLPNAKGTFLASKCLSLYGRGRIILLVA